MSPAFLRSSSLPASVLVSLLAITTSAASEDPAPDSTRKPVVLSPSRQAELRARLASADVAQVAWGAWDSAESGAREMVPDVIIALRRTLAAPVDEKTPFVLRAELDALIRLDARLAVADLTAASRVGSMRTQALVLAAREPKLHAASIEAMRADSRYEERIAIDNLLAAGALARAVALLLPDARVRITVHVLDEGMGRGSGGGHSSGIGCGSMKAPDGFPPTTLYSLVRDARKDDVVFADGPQPIAYNRIVRTEREFGVGGTSQGIDSAEHALSLLRWIAQDRKKGSSLEAQIALAHTWKDAATYLADVVPQIEERRYAWRALLAHLVADELLAPAQIPASEPIEVKVEDHRANPTVPLPPL